MELVNDQCRLVILLVVQILLGKLSVKVIVYSSGELHLVDEVKQHLRANALNLSKCDFLVLSDILNLQFSYLGKEVVQ